ncbi:MAG: carbohydrate porin [Bdellovibrionales bacterium]|nr:carbohydrate porin [Bdellovibrionales bacterium]
MKNCLYGLCAAILAASTLQSQANPSEGFEYTGYFRSGTGTNSLGGNYECFNNKKTSGNEFRIGNECATYGEATFTFHHLKSEKNDPFFKSQIRLAYVANDFGKAGTGTPVTYTNNGDAVFSLAEAYVQGGKFQDVPYTFWAGKRFYREPDLFMNDWFYYGNTVGNGAGVEEIPVGIGKLAIAQLRQVNTDAADGGRTEKGRPGITLWDARLKDIAITENDKLEFWVAYGHSPEGTSVATPTDVYEKGTGLIVGAKNHYEFDGGFYDAALIRGSGLMQSLELSGDSTPIKETSTPTTQKSTQQDALRWRLVNHVQYEIPNSKWAFHAGISHERWDSGAATKNLGKWTSVGILPVYFLTDHIQLTGQLGASLVDDESELNGSDPLGQRTLYRATIAPQIAINTKLSARPVLRAYYTQSWWNDKNKGASYVGANAPSFVDKTSGASYGFQAEVWF